MNALDVQSAHFCPTPQFSLNRKRAKKGRKADGLRYEALVNAHLGERHELYLPSPWLIYIVGGKPHWCQPDGICLQPEIGRLTIIEVKYSHTPDAYTQLRGLYSPVLARIFPPELWTQRLVEVCKWYDPDVAFPERVVMCPDPLAYDSPEIGVHIWRPA